MIFFKREEDGSFKLMFLLPLKIKSKESQRSVELKGSLDGLREEEWDISSCARVQSNGERGADLGGSICDFFKIVLN